MRVKVVFLALLGGCGEVLIQPADWKETPSLEGFKFMREFDDFCVFVSELWPRDYGVQVFVDVKNTSVREIRVDPAGFELRTARGTHRNTLPRVPVAIPCDDQVKIEAQFPCEAAVVRGYPSVLRFVVDAHGRAQEVTVQYRPVRK